MEMNTRLQVEHPVTEAITGLDLVEWQIRIALGEALTTHFSGLTETGHSIECRIYAEDPTKDFLPATGQLVICSLPQGDDIRLDTGYTSGDTLTPYYDPLLAKLITHGANRQEAIQKMQQALKQYCIAGLATNLSFLQAIMQHSAFMEGLLSTHFLIEHPISAISHGMPLPVIFLFFAEEYAKISFDDPIQEACFGWHPFLPRSWEVSFQHLQETILGKLQAHSTKAFTLAFQDNTYSLQYFKSPDKTNHGTKLYVSDGTQTYYGLSCDMAGMRYCFYEGQTYSFQRIHPTQIQQQTSANHASPMPGTVVAILKKAGDAIQADEGILIIEAMKMEHTIRAGEAGILTEIFYKTGDQVIEGAQLFELEETAKP
jgi:3-methylcrotonyl-CoA carboxylase alpha subunit